MYVDLTSLKMTLLLVVYQRLAFNTQLYCIWSVFGDSSVCGIFADFLTNH